MNGLFDTKEKAIAAVVQMIAGAFDLASAGAITIDDAKAHTAERLEMLWSRAVSDTVADMLGEPDLQ